MLTLGPHCLASFQFSHIVNITIIQPNNITILNTLYIHYLSHITTLYLIALLHYSHSYPTSLTADPHYPCNPGATTVVLCKRFCAISLPVWPGNLNLPPLLCDSQCAPNPRHTCSIQPINQATSCWILHTLAYILLDHPNNSSHPAPCIRWLINFTLGNRHIAGVGLASHTLLKCINITCQCIIISSIYNMYIAFVTYINISIYTIGNVLFIDSREHIEPAYTW